MTVLGWCGDEPTLRAADPSAGLKVDFLEDATDELLDSRNAMTWDALVRFPEP